METATLSLMRFKAWSDADLLRRLLDLPALAGTTEEFYATAIVRHFHTVDCIFQAHLRGVPHSYTSANPAEPATLLELHPRIIAIDEWYVQYARDLAESDLGELLRVSFTDGRQLPMTRSDILLHVALHGTGHRGQVGLLMRQLGAEPPPDRFSSYLGRPEVASSST